MARTVRKSGIAKLTNTIVLIYRRPACSIAKHKGLNVYAYVFMLNHIHLIALSPDMIGLSGISRNLFQKRCRKVSLPRNQTYWVF